MSIFDATALLAATTTEQSTRRPPLPVGEYNAVIGDLTTEEWVSSKDATKSGVKLKVPLTIDVPGDVQTALGLNEPALKVTDSFIIDLTESGTIDWAPGKNGKIRRYRDATGNNVAGRPFNLLALQGQLVKVRIGHREYPEGSGDLFEQVDGVVKA